MSDFDPIGSSPVKPIYRKLSLLLTFVFIVAILGAIAILVTEGFDWFLVFGIAICSWSAFFLVQNVIKKE